MCIKNHVFVQSVVVTVRCTKVASSLPIAVLDCHSTTVPAEKFVFCP